MHDRQFRSDSRPIVQSTFYQPQTDNQNRKDIILPYVTQKTKLVTGINDEIRFDNK